MDSITLLKSVTVKKKKKRVPFGILLTCHWTFYSQGD